LHMKTPLITLDKFTRFYEVRFYRLLTDYTNQYAYVLNWNHYLISDMRKLAYVEMISKISEKAKVVY
jgi:hypothetical protein